MNSTTEISGFTLLEVLVAVAVSSIIVVGLFEVFKTVIDARSFLSARDKTERSIVKTIELMEEDIRCKVGGFHVSREFGITKLEFETTHSLFFAGSLPVDVTYFMERINNREVLVREEKNKKAGEDLIIPLTSVFRSIGFKFYSHGEWVSKPSLVVKVSLTTSDGRRYTFVQRGMVGE